MSGIRDVAELATAGGRREPRSPRGRRGRRPQPDLGGARRRGRPDRHRPGRLRHRRRAPGADRDRQPDRVRDDLPRGAPGAGGRRAGQPARQGRRAGPDDRRLRARGWSWPTPTPWSPCAPPSTSCAARSDGGDGLDPELAARAIVPRVVVVGTTLLPGERSYDHLRADAARPAPPLQDPEKLAALLYTSGTSGLPRAAMLTHRALLANIEQVAQVEPPMMHGDDVVLGVLPLFHVYGLNAVLGGVLRHRAKLVLVERFDPQETLAIIDDEACSVVPVAPPVFAYWRSEPDLKERLGPVRLMLSGSAPLSPEVVREFTDRTGVPVHQGYGLTEASPVVTSTLCSDGLPGRLGRRRAAGHRRPAGRRRRAAAGGRRPRRDRDPRRQPVQRLLARRRRRARTPRAGGPPATSASSTTAATCSWSTGSRSWSSSPASTSTRSRSRT